MLPVRLVTSEEELIALHVAHQALEDPLRCDPDALPAPHLGALIVYAEDFDVYLASDKRGPIAYAVAGGTGTIHWLVFCRPASAAKKAIVALCRAVAAKRGACRGTVRNDEVRALFPRTLFDIEGEQVSLK